VRLRDQGRRQTPTPGVVTALVALLSLAGCATGWQALRDRETRTGESYTSLDLALQVHATRVGPALQEALARARCEARGCTPVERDAVVSEARAHARQHLRFVLGVYTREPSWNDLEREDSRWRIHLEAEGRDVKPDEIRRIRGDRPGYDRLFPDLTGFQVAYEVDLPTPAWPEGPMTLHVAGVLGRVALIWREEGR